MKYKNYFHLGFNTLFTHFEQGIGSKKIFSRLLHQSNFN